MLYKYNPITGKLDITSNTEVVLQSGSAYPASSAQSVIYKGYNYPANLRVGQDIWLQEPAPTVQTAITNISNTELRLNWNVPTYIDYLGNTVNADVFTYYWEVYSDVGLTTLVQSGSTSNLTQLVTGLTQNTTYYTRIAHGDITQGNISYSNTITVSTTNVQTIFSSAVALSPQYAYNFEPVLVSDVTVSNQGAETGTSITKSGTFTKNIGLISGADARLRFNFVNTLQLGHTDQNGIDWVLILRYDSNNVSGNAQLGMYNNINLASSARLEIFATGFNENPAISLRDSTNTVITPNNTLLGNGAGDRLDMILKVGNTIKTYRKGSTVPVNTLTIPAGTSVPLKNLRWFENLLGVTQLNIEAIYSVFAHGTVVTNNEQDWIDLMLLPNS